MKDIDSTHMAYFISVAKRASKMYGDPLEWNNFDVMDYVKRGRIVVCYRKGALKGVMLSRLFSSIFDIKTKVVMQDLLWTETPRAAYLLMQDFIDFGKLNADHIITMRAKYTCIKESSLESQGFKKLETLYRLEV